MRHSFAPAHKGQTLVLFALMSLMLLAGLGLIFDAGLDYNYRRTMQNAADVASLRGARLISQKGTGGVLTTVVNTAISNGVQSAAFVTCDFMNDAKAIVKACDDNAIPSGVTGVRVRVSETHATLVMRALGITTSGTAATAAAQVQMVWETDSTDIPFVVCGYQTKTTSGSIFNILPVETRTDPQPNPPIPPSTTPGTPYETVPDGAIQIASGAYSYDWNSRDANGNYVSLGGPQFIIGGPNIARCGVASDWQGLRARPVTSTRFRLRVTGVDQITTTLLKGAPAVETDVLPVHSFNGTQGCKAPSNPTVAEWPNNCIMLLPIAHNLPVCPSQCIYTSDADREQYSTSLQSRLWGVFYITSNGAGTEYYGRLIKNYPLHTDGITGWDPTTYVGPLTVKLVQAP